MEFYEFIDNEKLLKQYNRQQYLLLWWKNNGKKYNKSSLDRYHQYAQNEERYKHILLLKKIRYHKNKLLKQQK